METKLYQWNIILFQRRHTVFAIAKSHEEAFSLALNQTNDTKIKKDLKNALELGNLIIHSSPDCFITSEWAQIDLNVL